MNMEAIGYISKVLFDVHDRGGYLMHSGNGTSVGPDLKIKLMEVYNQQSLKSSNKFPNDTPIDERTVEFIHILPTLAQTSDFFDRLNRHAENFCRTIESNIADSIEIQDALEELNKQHRSKRIDLKESLRELKGVGNFMETILNKVENGVTITDNEKTIFKFLLANILKIDQNTDISNLEHIIKTLIKYFHPDRCSGKNSDLYSCILSNGLRIIDHIKILWDVEKTVNSRSQKGISHESTIDSLIESIANLKKIDNCYRLKTFEKIRKEMLALKANDLKDNDKVRLLMSIIQVDSPSILKTMINHLGINNLKVNNEKPLIYAIQNTAVEVIKILIEKEDINAPGLEGKTPLQIAIDCYKIKKDNFCPGNSARIVHSILDCHKVCVDAKDSEGKTALCHIAFQENVGSDSLSLEIIKKLINLGANIDQPIMHDLTVRSFLKRELTKKKFHDIETLADSLKDLRNAGFPLISSIAKLNTLTDMDRSKAYEKIRKEMLALKASDLNDNDKARLLKSVIQTDTSELMEIMINRLSINNLKVNNETPLIYAIQNTAVKVVKLIIEKEDVNAPGLEGKTPLQVAIDCYKKRKDKDTNGDLTEIIQSLLESHKLCVDAKDSKGFTALCHIVSQINIDSTSLEIINKLVNLGANIDHPILHDITLRSFIKDRLNEKQFYDLEILADSLEDLRNGRLPLIASIAKLNTLTNMDRFKACKKIEKEMLALKASDLKGDDKERLLMSVIKTDTSELMKIMINHLSINNLKVNNETQLIYAIQHAAVKVVKLLIEKEDINAPGLKGKTPLQIAIDCYKQSKDGNTNSDYTVIIQSLLESHKLCVDTKDSEGKTALSHIAFQEEIDSTSLDIINKLVNLGANIDQPIVHDITVRSFIKSRLSKQQFYDIETLADNLKDLRVGVEFHGDDIVALIDEYNKTSHNNDKARKKVEEAISNRKTLLQKKDCKKTVLMAAIESNALSFIQLLLKRSDFTLDQLTTEGDSPLDYARKKGAHTIVEFLSDVVSTTGTFPTNSGNTKQSSNSPFTNTSTDGATPPKIQKMS
ncbi:ankyrin repeat domain-containing protein [Endozoicomonas sp. 2B-B]